MTTTLRNAWITPAPTLPRRVYVTIREDGRHGVVWDGVSLHKQLARDAIAVVFGDGEPARYYRKSEIEIQEKS